MTHSKQQDRNNAAYERGVRNGKEGGFIDDVAHSFDITISQEDEIYDKGYSYGAQHRYDEKPTKSSGGSSNSDSTSKGVCFLTTACTKSRGLSDSCLELVVLRKFRDKILLPSPEGRKAVKEYYAIAPEIVQAVNARQESSQIWNNVYNQIERSIQAINLGDYNKSFKIYKDIVLVLKKVILN